ncbi:hypothetical protein QQZ08_009734 [Neonectria magnoliae]|uniref:Uncharacterized protein n=1 Tax=Neonectria magnoliae TaxID=2732573 RepID=A0ABR1HL28_9HYPO
MSHQHQTGSNGPSSDPIDCLLDYDAARPSHGVDCDDGFESDAARLNYVPDHADSPEGEGYTPSLMTCTPGLYQSDLRQAESVESRVPPKDAEEGSWKYTHQAPAWTDPTWEDDGPQRWNTDWPITDAVMSRMRPALLARDQIRDPTAYAKRFGIFHDRSDGRSRASPTRAESRQLFRHGNVRTGKDLFDRLEKLAANKGKCLDDFMAEERIDMTEMDPADQECMQRYEDLLIDEYWQGLLFGDLTMDEKNDRVWDALQPALQLTSRLLRAKEPFIAAVQDPSNRFYVDKGLDPRSNEEKSTCPKFKFRRTVDMNDPDLLPSAREMRQIRDFDPKTFTYKVLDRVLELNIRGGHYHFSSDFALNGPSGVTMNYGLGWADHPIKISLAAELVWPLLVETYSASEKMMASFTIATTLVHEMMHAFVAAQYRWLANPAEFGIPDPLSQAACQRLYNDLCPGGYRNWIPEPSFENDPVSEVGHAYEQHVLGGSTWPLLGQMCQRGGPPFVGEYAGLAVRVMWPDGMGESQQVLTEPKLRTEQYSHFIRIGDAQKYFTEAFWEVSVEKYGMAALRQQSDKPHKVFFSPDEARYNQVVLPDLHTGSVEDQRWVNDYIIRLYNNGKQTLHTYLMILISEAFQFDLMAKRFIKNRKNWDERQRVLKQSGILTLMVFSEFRGHMLLLSGKGERETDAGIKAEYQTWERLALSTQASPDGYSKRCIGGHEKFRNAIFKLVLAQHCERIIRSLMDLVQGFEEEREYQESMMCELYQLPSEYWTHYKNRLRSHYKFWDDHAGFILKMLLTIMDTANEISNAMPEWNNEWKGRVQNLMTAFGNIQRLLKLDTNHMRDSDWRDLLKTVPMLRKSRHKSHERIFFLAKKEMLNLTGQELEDLRECKTRIQRLISLESYKIVLPDTEVDTQGLSQRWAGLLDDVLEKQVSGSKVASIFNTKSVQNLVQALEEEGRKAEAFKLDHAANRESSKMIQTQQSPTLQHMAASGALQPPRTPPRETLVALPGHATPLGSAQWGQPSTLGPRFSGFSPNSRAFTPYSSGRTKFPRRREGSTPPWSLAGVDDSAVQPNMPSALPRAFGGIMPHPYAVRETVTRDLFNVPADKPNVVPVDTFSHQGPRENTPIPWNPGRQGTGGLGNLDETWEQQAYNEGMVEETRPEPMDQELDEEALGVRNVLGTWLQNEPRTEEHEDNNFSGSAFMLRLRGSAIDSKSNSSATLSLRNRESSDSTARKSDSLSGSDTEMDLHHEDEEVVGHQTAVLKRKECWESKSVAKRAKRGLRRWL